MVSISHTACLARSGHALTKHAVAPVFNHGQLHTKLGHALYRVLIV